MFLISIGLSIRASVFYQAFRRYTDCRRSIVEGLPAVLLVRRLYGGLEGVTPILTGRAHHL